MYFALSAFVSYLRYNSHTSPLLYVKIRFIDDTLFADRTFVLGAYKQGSYIALWRCSERIRADVNVAIAAVAHDGSAMQVNAFTCMLGLLCTTQTIKNLTQKGLVRKIHVVCRKPPSRSNLLSTFLRTELRTLCHAQYPCCPCLSI